MLKEKIDFLIENGLLKTDDPMYHLFVTNIVPNVVFKTFGHWYDCAFDLCDFKANTGESIEIHLRDDHYDQIPNGVFGEKQMFKCKECRQSFEGFNKYKVHREECYLLSHYFEEVKVF